MRKLYRVKKDYDFEYIINNGNTIKSKNFIIYFKTNNFPYDRFGISVGKKIGNAVTRNKYKRKIRAIIDNIKKTFNNQTDYIIILRKNALNKSFSLLSNDLKDMLQKTRKEI